MGCNCKMTESILALVVIIFAFWSTFQYSKWVVVIAGLILLWHANMCKNHKK